MPKTEDSLPASPASPTHGFGQCSIGIDFGDLWIRIASVTPSQHVPSIVRNNMSNEITPAAVAFQLDAERLVGEDALGKLVSSPHSSVSHLRRLLGQDFTSEEFRKAAGLVHFQLDVSTHSVVLTVPGAEEAHHLSPVQLTATLIKRALHFARQHHKAPEDAQPRSVVVNVPQHYSDAQRAALRDALLVAGVPADRARLVPDGAANALFWHHSHYAELSTSDAEQKVVAIVDVGHSHSSVSISSISKTAVRRIASASVPVGGSSVDQQLVRRCLADAKDKTGIDFTSKPKVVARIEREARKAKESLSCVEKTRLSCELNDEHDLDRWVERGELEQYCEGLVEAVASVCRSALEQAKAGEGDAFVLDRVEVIGGAVRIPLVQAKVTEVLLSSNSNTPLQRTMDPSQSTAQGCALAGQRQAPTADTRIVLSTLISKADHARRSIETIHFVDLTPPLLPDVPKGLSDDAIAALAQAEFQLEEQDRVYRDTAHARNAVEEFIYKYRGHLDSSAMKKALAGPDVEQAQSLLRQAELWLTEGEGERADKATYEEKLASLKATLQERFPGIQQELQRQAQEQAKRDAEAAEEARKAAAENKREPRTDKERLQFADERKQQGNELFKQQHYHECIQRYVQALVYLGELYAAEDEDLKTQKTEISFSCYLNIAAASLKIEEYKRCVDNCNKALELKPDSAKAHFRKGQAYALLQEFADARKALDRALQLDPEEKAIQKELAALQKKEQLHLEKQKKMFSKMFA